MHFHTHIFWHFMFYGPILQGVQLTITLAVLSQVLGIVLGTFTALGRLSTLKVGPRFVFVGVASGAAAALVHPLLAGEFNAWWTRNIALPVPGGVETWLAVLLAAFGVAWFGVGLFGRIRYDAPSMIHRISNPSWYPFRTISGVYIWLFRGTPLLVQLAFVYFALPEMTGGRLIIDSYWSAAIALSLNEGAYMAEIVRAGIASVDSGQIEAAQSLGMTRALAMRRIVLPQAVRIIIPPTGNEFISMLKNTSLASVISVFDLFNQQQLVTNSFGGPGAGDYFELLSVAAVWYLIMTTVFTFLQGHVERYFERGFTRELRQPGTMQRLMVGALRRG